MGIGQPLESETTKLHNDAFVRPKDGSAGVGRPTDYWDRESCNKRIRIAQQFPWRGIVRDTGIADLDDVTRDVVTNNPIAIVPVIGSGGIVKVGILFDPPCVSCYCDI